MKPMQYFREISESHARRIDRTIAGLANLTSFEELEERFVSESVKLLPGDCISWNNWTPDLSSLINYRNNEGYNEPFAKMVNVFENVIGNHPIIAAGAFADTVREVKRMSDFQSFSGFKENPLFREVYRHLDSHFQMAYIPCVLKDRALILSWNRKFSDFSTGDMQVMHFMGSRLAVIARRLEERRLLESSLNCLCEHISSGMVLESVGSLGEKDVAILTGLLGLRPRTELAKISGVRRDSLDKRLGSIRERLGLENHHQLLSALAEMKHNRP